MSNYLKVALPIVTVNIVAEGGMRRTEIRPVYRPKFGTGLTPEFFPDAGEILPVAPPVTPITINVGIGNLKMAQYTESPNSDPFVVRGTLRGSSAVLAQYIQFSSTN